MLKNIVISKLFKTKANSKYCIRHLDKVIKPLILIMPNRLIYAKTFKVKEGDKDKNNKLIFFYIDNEKLLKEFTAVWSKIESLKILN